MCIEKGERRPPLPFPSRSSLFFSRRQLKNACLTLNGFSGSLFLLLRPLPLSSFLLPPRYHYSTSPPFSQGVRTAAVAATLPPFAPSPHYASKLSSPLLPLAGKRWNPRWPPEKGGTPLDAATLAHWRGAALSAAVAHTVQCTLAQNGWGKTGAKK